MKHLSIQNGFTLVEILISLVIFSLGMLGTASLLSSEMKVTIDNHARAIALPAVMAAMEPLYLSASGNDLKTALAAFDPNADGNYNDLTVTNNGGRDSFTITINEALDNAGSNVLTTPPPYVSPIRVAISVAYAGKTGVKVTRGHFTYILATP
ncbi:MAG: prepilin-type N-terminal cleavage/methylation domain-containing protein [Gammaproteobacteria bacterium]|nr:prepilin-type N-terminal cleavage/methylation domain-containing protein [Gammaproteobacteria bacterium]